MTIEITGDEITTFKSFDQWTSRSEILRYDKKNQVSVCVDALGFLCLINDDFLSATYPVVAYRLKRVRE